MKKYIKVPLLVLFLIFWGLCLSTSCGRSVRLTASWSNGRKDIAFVKILVMAIGKDLEKRKLAEAAIKREMAGNYIPAVTSIEEFGPDFATQYDSTRIRQALLSKRFDGVLTVRVLDVHEHDRWVPGDDYYGPISFYRRFYGYYYRVWKHYIDTGYTVTDVEVLLESNLYQVETGTLVWSGQSKAFSRNPTPAMAARYAKNIIKDILRKEVVFR